MDDVFGAATWNCFHGTPAKELLTILEHQVEEKDIKLVLGQEFAKRKQREIFTAIGWEVFWHSPQYLIAWDPTWFTAIGSGLGVRLSDQHYYRKGDDQKQFSEAAQQILCDPVGHSLTALSYHLAPHTQVPDKNRPENRFVSTIESVATISEIAREAKTTGSLTGGDDNVDEGAGVGSNNGLWLPMLAKASGLRQIQAPSGTHGKRRIDDFRIPVKGNLRLVRGEGWVVDGGGDHGLHGEYFGWKAA